MLKLIFAALLLVSFSSQADEWTESDIKYEAAYLALHTVDWGQTRNIAKNPSRYSEVNPVLGKHPMHLDQ